MSLLMFTLDDPGALVVTDTLATTNAGDPHLMVSKCVIVPHLEMVVAFTGIAQVGHRWSQLVQTAVLARDIDMLDQHVPEGLRGVTDDLEREEDAPLPTTSTVYHIGFSESQQRYVGYAYRSANNFVSEHMEPSFRVKPEPKEQFDVPESPEEMIDLAVRVRKEQDELPSSERLYIGGELVLTALVSRVITTTKIFRFPDFDAQWTAMNNALRQQSG